MKSNFEQQVIEAIPRLVRYAQIFLRDSHQAEDFAQEVILRVLKKQKSFNPEKGTVGSWLRGFAVRVLREYQRQNQVIVYEQIDIDHIFLQWEQDEDEEPLIVMRGCINKLQKKDKHILKMRYAEKAAIKDIACSLEKTNEAVKTKLHRLRNTLLECITKKLNQESI